MNDILEKIQAYDTIIIHRHQNPDPDAIGSQVGLRDLLRAHFPQKRVLATGYDEPTLTWLAEMDDVKDENYEGALVIVCDTANTPRIDDKRYTTGDFLIKIDHHPNDDAYGDLLWVDTDSSSTSELIALFAKELDLELPVSAARLLYAGIVGDTGRFLYPATSTRTFELAAFLRSIPFDFTALARQMDTINLKTAKLQGYVYDHLEIDEHGAARVTLTQELLKKFDLRDSETAAIVGAPGWSQLLLSRRKRPNLQRATRSGSPKRRLRTVSQPFYLDMGFSYTFTCGKIKLINFKETYYGKKSFVYHYLCCGSDS